MTTSRRRSAFRAPRRGGARRPCARRSQPVVRRDRRHPCSAGRRSLHDTARSGSRPGSGPASRDRVAVEASCRSRGEPQQPCAGGAGPARGTSCRSWRARRPALAPPRRPHRWCRASGPTRHGTVAARDSADSPGRSPRSPCAAARRVPRREQPRPPGLARQLRRGRSRAGGDPRQHRRSRDPPVGVRLQPAGAAQAAAGAVQHLRHGPGGHPEHGGGHGAGHGLGVVAPT